jgi:hypothetical protein
VNVLPGAGDGNFGGVVQTLLPDDPIDVAAADFDEDGTTDLAVLSATTRTVHVLHGNGDGTFVPAGDVQLADQPVRIGTADFNDDGHADLVIAGGDDVVTAFAGSGLGSFASGQSFAVGHGPVDLALADLSGDTLPDIVVVNSGGNDVTVLRNTTRVTFPPTATVGPGTPTLTPIPTRTPVPTRTPRGQPTASGGTDSGGGSSGCTVSPVAPSPWWLAVLAASAWTLRRRREQRR